MTSPDRTGVVLAGGTSRRFDGGEKALATLDGQAFVARVVERLGTTASDTVVAVRTPEQEAAVEGVLADVDCDVTFVRDSERFEGPLAGVHAALDAIDTPWFALLGCDMPLFDPRVIEWLATVTDDDADAVVPLADQPQPLQALYRTAAVEAVADDLPLAGGLFALLDALEPVERVPVAAAPSSLPVERSLTNVNTAAGLTAIRTGEF